jgi:ornithine carbamoyltransferase
MSVQHFLTLGDLSGEAIKTILARAIALKAKKSDTSNQPMRGKVLGMIFEKSSTRTRISFEAGIAQLGGSAIFLSPADTQLGRGESIEDTARVLSRMVDLITVRTFEQERIELFARHSVVPVINTLTDDFHPCQLLADMQTYTEHRGDISGKTVAWVGDGNNMCQSYINAAAKLDFKLNIACPENFLPRADLLSKHADRVSVSDDPVQAVKGADLVVTDTWASMGKEQEKIEREQIFASFQVNHQLMEEASKEALFMHCLPAYRGLEVSGALLEDLRYSVVWDEAENRLHAQKALMLYLLDINT